MYPHHKLIAEGLEDAVERLAKGGARIHFTFPEELMKGQSSWPEDCPVSEEELREELGAALVEIRGLGERIKQLKDRLPPAPEDLGEAPGGFEDGPASVYETLSSVVTYVVDDVIPDIERQVTQALAATPESLRSEWLKHQVPRTVAELLCRVVPEAERYGWTEGD
jgi:hypothetical protein